MSYALVSNSQDEYEARTREVVKGNAQLYGPIERLSSSLAHKEIHNAGSAKFVKEIQFDAGLAYTKSLLAVSETGNITKVNLKPVDF